METNEVILTMRFVICYLYRHNKCSFVCAKRLCTNKTSNYLPNFCCSIQNMKDCWTFEMF